jgi:hypothetical protein
MMMRRRRRRGCSAQRLLAGYARVAELHRIQQSSALLGVSQLHAFVLLATT